MAEAKFEKIISESERKYSPNNEGIISVFRHGKKTPEGELAPEGFGQAREIGEVTERVGIIAKDYGSPVQRAQDMARETANTLANKKVEDPNTGEKLTGEKYKSRVREGLSFAEKGRMPQWFVRMLGPESTFKQSANKFLETYLAFGEKRPDKTTLSPKEMASRVAEVLLLQIRTIGRLKSGSKVNLADASHSPTLDVFIAEFLKEQIEEDPINPQGESLVEKMGGTFKMAEGFEVHVKTDEQGKLSADLSFRGKKYNVDVDELRRLSRFRQQKKQEKE